MRHFLFLSLNTMLPTKSVPCDLHGNAIERSSILFILSSGNMISNTLCAAFFVGSKLSKPPDDATTSHLHGDLCRAPSVLSAVSTSLWDSRFFLPTVRVSFGVDGLKATHNSDMPSPVG